MVRIAFKTRGDATVLADLHQEGCLKARFPTPRNVHWAEAVQLNNSGGVASADQLTTQLHFAPHTRAIMTTASAERIYRRPPCGAPAVIRTHIRIGAAACAEWLPQETIVFDDAGFDRALSVDMADDAHLLAAETLVFGRIAMGETVHRAVIRDVVRIRRGGQLILHDAFRPPEPIAATLNRMAAGNGARALATLWQVSPHAGAVIGPIRAVLDVHPDVEAGVSSWDGVMVVRLLARSPVALRATLAAVLHVLRDGRMLPAHW